MERACAVRALVQDGSHKRGVLCNQQTTCVKMRVTYETLDFQSIAEVGIRIFVERSDDFSNIV